MILPKRFCRGFTLLELLLCLGVVLISSALLLPGLRKLHLADARLQCVDNLRQIGNASCAYALANRDVLPRNSVRAPKGSWNTQLLPLLGKEKLAKQYAEGHDWWDTEASGNRTVAATRIPVFQCPSAPNPNRWVLTADPENPVRSFRAAPTDYVGSAGAYHENNLPESLHPGAMQHRLITRRVRTSDILDGTAQTLLVVEMADKPNSWRAGKLGEDRSRRPQMLALAGQWAAPNWNHLRSHSLDGKSAFGPCAVNCSNQAGIYGFHPTGANVLFVDGSVRLLRNGMSQELLIALVSIAGGELLEPNDY